MRSDRTLIKSALLFCEGDLYAYYLGLTCCLTGAFAAAAAAAAEEEVDFRFQFLELRAGASGF